MGSTARLSVIQYLGESGSTCGYCHSEDDTSVSTGMWCQSLSVEQYQQLVLLTPVASAQLAHHDQRVPVQDGL